ncbi:MAG: hypothetical protein OHK0039_05800 [Bacteroidia bacterium]
MSAQAQFQVNGNAFANGPTCYTITQNLPTQAGSVWYQNTIDLSQSFDLQADVFLGCSNGGADGMVFVFQPVSTSAGGGGGGLGYQGITPSLGIEMDTYQNSGFGDPTFDHVAIVSNGSVDHTAATNLAGPVSLLASAGNAEDCLWHDLHVSWDPQLDQLRVYFDCSLRLTYTGDIVSTLFGGNPLVYWGFTAGTGALSNLQQFCYTSISYGLDTTICQGESVPLSAGTGTAYSWSPTAGLSSSTSANPVATPDTTTLYLCTITDNCGFTRQESFQITVRDTVPVFSLGADTSLCPGSSLILGVPFAGFDLLWQDGSTGASLVATPGSLYWLEVQGGCDTLRDSVELIALPPGPTIDLGPDLTPCAGDTLLLDASQPDVLSYLWQDSSSAPALPVTSSGLYWVAATNTCGTAGDSIQIAYIPILPPPDLGPDTVLCDLPLWVLDAQLPGATYLWSDGSTGPQLPVVADGSYWVEAGNSCGVGRDSVSLAFQRRPQVNLGSDTSICIGRAVAWDITWTPGTSYVWQNGSTEPQFQTLAAGQYIALLTNVCGTASDTVQVATITPPPALRLGPDTTLCTGSTLLLGPGLPGYAYLWQDGSTDSLLTADAPGTYVLQISNQCAARRDSIVLRYLDPPIVDLGPDLTRCAGETVAIDVRWPEATYLWEDNSTQPQRVLSEAGQYSVLLRNQCGSASDSFELTYLPSIRPIDLGGDRQLCPGDSLVWDTDQGSAFSYAWSHGSTQPRLVVREAGTYTLTAGNDCGTTTSSARISYLPLPRVDLGADTLICTDRERPLVLDASHPTAAAYRWQDGSTAPGYVVQIPGTYHVTLSNVCGSASDTVEVAPTTCFCAAHAPTAFSPNGDAQNEQFQVWYACGLTEGRLMVFNRWGSKVFETRNLGEAWDGTYRGQPCPQGVYVWVYEFHYLEAGRTRFWTDQGTITLIR